MIEISEKTIASLAQSKENAFIRQALEDWKYLRELKSSKAFEWFRKLMENEIRGMEVKIMNPRMISDVEMGKERIRILEWKKLLLFLDRKEKEVRGILEKNQREEFST